MFLKRNTCEQNRGECPVLRNAKEICSFIKRDHRKIKDLIAEGLPAWKEDGVYYALPEDLIEWLKKRRDKYLKK